jgi:nitronate monooxygenase
VFALTDLQHPIVQAPMGGGPSTTALAAAVCEAGGLGFLAAGYRDVTDVRAEVAELRSLTSRPFAVNVFAPPGEPGDAGEVERYVARLRGWLGDEGGEAEGAAAGIGASTVHGGGEGERVPGSGVALGAPRHHDDGYAEKVVLVAELAVPVVSFTFGCPGRDEVALLQRAGCAVWVTVTTVAEARVAAEAGADALVVQGVEAGGHRGSFDDAAPGDVGLLSLLRLVAAATDMPLVATGGIADGAGVAAVVVAGAAAAQLGTAFMLCPEAATAPAHRDALRTPAPTALTRAFTGRTARGIANRFMREHDAAAPSAYPEIHHVTAPLRAAARSAGDADGFHLWAGQAHELARELPAGDLVRELATEARAALDAAGARLGT